MAAITLDSSASYQFRLQCVYGSWNRRSCGYIGCSDASATRIALPAHTSRRVSPGGRKLSRFGTYSFECVCCGWRKGGWGGVLTASSPLAHSPHPWRNRILFMILTVITSYAGVCRKVPCHLLFSTDWLRDRLIVLLFYESRRRKRIR